MAPREIWPIALLLGLSACYKEADYEAEYTEAICDKYFECYDEAQQENLSWSSAEDCYEERDTPLVTEDSTCEFDSDNAKLCVEETRDLACADLYDGRWPTPCASVCGE